MNLHFYFVIAQTICLQIAAMYHEMSMEVFEPPYPLRDDAFFGYSVAYDQVHKRLIVSAPRADDVGQIFSCNLTSSDKKCAVINDFIPAKDLERDRTKNRTHDFWLGASIKAGKSFFVTCAPRYLSISDKWQKPGTFGRCYMESNQSQPMKQISNNERMTDSPLFENQTDSFGWSIEITPNDAVLVGSPAMSSGRVMAYDKPVSQPILVNGRNNPNNVQFNFGYSIASGNFFSDTEKSYAIGTTYGEYGHGKVLFYNEKYKPIEYLQDQDTGTMFAASLCSAKLTDKLRHDLIVGAPAFALDHSYDVGAVYIYIIDKNNKFILTNEYYGSQDGGRFGSAMVSVGDLDGDERDEIAISAPYEDSGRGAVYLYSGADLISHKADKRYLQRIQPEPSGTQLAFGLSLTSLNDYDENGCNELAIGAPSNSSNSVVILKCLSSITIVVDAEFPNLQNRDPQLLDFMPCIMVTYPEKPKNITADILVTVQIRHPNARLGNAKADGVKKYTQSLETKQPKYCKNLKIITPLDGDYEQVIWYSISAELLNDPMKNIDFHGSLVTLSQRSILSVSDSVWVADCGNKDHICIPKLHVNVTTTLTNPYLIGSSNRENVTINVYNTGETAYSACLRVRISGAGVWRASACTNKDRVLTCSPRGPLRNDNKWSTGDIILETEKITSENRAITIEVELYNQCKNISQVERFNNTVIELVGDSDGLIVTGATNWGDVVDMTNNEVRYAGKQIDHVYTIQNNGLTKWVGLKCEITLQKKLYLKYSYIKVYNDASPYSQCRISEDGNSQSDIKVICDIGDLGAKNKVQVFVPIDILPGVLEGVLDKENVTATTKLEVILRNKKKFHSVSTVLCLQKTNVPLWIILVASLIGLLFLVIIAFILYEVGFLRRKNKEKLVELKREIRRQSMRRSMADRSGTRASLHSQDERLKLIAKELKEKKHTHSVDSEQSADKCYDEY